MNAWFTAAVPFWTAAVVQVLAGVVRVGTSQVSRAYFKGTEDKDNYVPPDEAANGEFKAVPPRKYLPKQYFSENVGRVFGKNGDAAILFTGTVTLLTSFLVNVGGISPLTSVMAIGGLSVGIWRGIVLLRLPVDEYKPRIHERVELSSTVVVLVLAFVLAGGLAAAYSIAQAGPTPTLSPTPTPTTALSPTPTP